MVKCIVSNRLEITGLPKDLEEHYQYKCQYSTSVYQTEDIPEVLNLFEKTPNGIKIPRGLLVEVYNSCLKRGLEVELVNNGFAGETYNHKIKSNINYTSGVYGYQGRVVENLMQYTTARLQAPAGSGKTCMMCLIAALANKGPVLYLANKQRLIKQFMLTAEKVLGVKEEDIGLIKQKKCKIKPLTCGSLQTMGKDSFDLESLKHSFHTIFYDESHLSTALTYRRVLLGLAPERLYGFSATPDHYASEELNHLMLAMLGPVGVVVSDEEIPGRLIPDVYTRFTGNSYFFDADSESEEWYRRKQRHKLYDSLGNSVPRNNLIVEDALKLLSVGHKLLICVNRVSQGKKIYDLLIAKGVKCSFPYKITTNKKGEEKSQPNHKQLDEDVFEIEKGNIDCIIGTYKLFDTGFDCPPLSAILYAAPFSGDNTTQITQTAGRVQRFRLDKQHPIVLDYLDDSFPVNVLHDWGCKRAEFLQKSFRHYDIIR